LLKPDLSEGKITVKIGQDAEVGVALPFLPSILKSFKSYDFALTVTYARYVGVSRYEPLIALMFAEVKLPYEGISIYNMG